VWALRASGVNAESPTALHGQPPGHNPSVRRAVDRAPFERRKIAALGMGRYGALTRVAAPALGSLFAYAFTNSSEPLVKNQLTVKADVLPISDRVLMKPLSLLSALASSSVLTSMILMNEMQK